MKKLLLVVAVTVCAALALGTVQAPAAPKAVTKIVRTYAGTDFHSLDHAFLVQEIANSGGSVYVYLNDIQDKPDKWYLEANLDLPVGAQVTRVVFYGCGDSLEFKYYVGSYGVKAGTFTFHVPATTVPQIACPQRFTATETAPILTVTAGRRYMLGIEIPSATTARRTLDTAQWMLSGASLTYTCPSTCT